MDFNSINNHYYYYQILPIHPIVPTKDSLDSSEQKKEDNRQESFAKILRKTQNKAKGK